MTLKFLVIFSCLFGLSACGFKNNSDQGEKLITNDSILSVDKTSQKGLSIEEMQKGIQRLDSILEHDSLDIHKRSHVDSVFLEMREKALDKELQNMQEDYEKLASEIEELKKKLEDSGRTIED